MEKGSKDAANKVEAEIHEDPQVLIISLTNTDTKACSTIDRILNETCINIDCKTKDWYGKTVLHKASEIGYTITMGLLLDRGAQVDIRSNFG